MDYIGVRLVYDVNYKELTDEKKLYISSLIDMYMHEIDVYCEVIYPDYTSVEYEKNYSSGSIIVDIFTALSSPVISAPLNAYALYSIFYTINKNVIQERTRYKDKKVKYEPTLGDIWASSLQTEPFGDDIGFVLSIGASAEVKHRLRDAGVILEDETVYFTPNPPTASVRHRP